MIRHVRRWYVYVPLSLLILGFLLWRTRPWDAGHLLADADGLPLLGALGLDVVIIVLWAGRSGLLLADLGSRIPIRDLVPIVSFANTINGITPASAGEVLRAVVLNQRHAVPYRDGIAVIILERFYALYLIVVATVTAWLAIGAQQVLIVILAIAAPASAMLPSAVYAGGFRFSGPALQLARHSPIGGERLLGLARRLVEVEHVVARFLVSARPAIVFVVSTATVFLAMDLQLLLIAASIGVSIDPIVGWLALGVGAIAGVLSALPFGLGAADVVIAAILIWAGVGAPEAGLITVLQRLVATLPTGLIGAASYLYLMRSGPALDRAVPTERPD